MQTRYIAGWSHYWRAPTSSTLLNAAKRNLRDKYASFGLQDRFEESLERIAGDFDWTIGPVQKQGARPKQTVIDKTPDEEDLDAVAHWSQLDNELYSYAQELFRQRVGGMR